MTKNNIDFINQNVLYVSDAGSPCISDPGALLVDYCISNNIKYDFIGGSNALINAYAMSGFLESPFLFYGFLAKKGKKRLDEIDKLLASQYLSIIYEAPHRIIDLISSIAKKNEQKIVFAIKELTKKNQKYFKGKAKDIVQELEQSNTKGEWVVIIDSNKSENKGKEINLDDILKLDISHKNKSKLISKLTGRNTKDIYKEFF